MYKKILAITFAIMFLSSTLSVSSGTITPAFADKQNHNNHLPKLSSKIPFGMGLPNSWAQFGLLTTVAVNPSTQRLYAVFSDKAGNGCLDVIDEKTLSSIANVTLGTTYNLSIAINEKTNRIYLEDYGSTNFTLPVYNSTLVVVDGKTNKVIDRLQVGQNADITGIDDKTNRIYVDDYDNNILRVVDGNTDKIIYTFKNLSEALIGVNEDDNKIYVGVYGITLPNGTIDYNQSEMYVLDENNYKQLATIPLDGAGPTSIVINEQTDKIYVTSEIDNSITEINGKTNQVLGHNIITSYEAFVAALSSKLNKVYVTDPFLSTLIVVDGKTDQAIDTIPVGTPMPACFYNGTCTDLGTFPGMITLDDNLGKIYVGGNGDGILYIFDINTHHMIGEMHMGVYHHK